MLHPYAHAIERAGRRRPEHTAVIDVAADQRLTWRELVTRAGRLAGALRADGVGVGDRVCLVQANRADYLVALAATAWLGAAFVPVLGSLAARERDEIIAMVRPAAVLDPAAGLPSAAGEWVPPEQADPSTVGQILFTSGSTGTPKGVMHSFAGSRAAIAAWAQLTAGGPPPRILVTTPISHAAGRLVEAVIPVGGTIVVQDGADAAATLAGIERFGVTHALVVPTVLQRIVDHPDLPARDLSSLRFVLYSAAPASPTLVSRAHHRLGEVLHTVWGSTELPAPNTHLGPAEHALGVTSRPRLLRSCGREFTSDVQLRVVDESLADVPDGTTGQVAASAGWLASGYWERPDLWSARLAGDRFLTGDIGTMEDGYLYLSDRVDDLVITGGSNVYPTEVEQVLAEHPAVREAAVVGVPDPRRGEAVTAVVVITTTPDGVPAGLEAELVAHCRQRLTSYKVPKRVLVVDELPRTALGKVSRRQVRHVALALLGLRDGDRGPT